MLRVWLHTARDLSNQEIMYSIIYYGASRAGLESP